MKRIIILIIMLLLLSACTNEGGLVIEDSDQFEFTIMKSTVEEIVSNGYEICTTDGLPYTDLNQHVIDMKTWSYFTLYKDNKFISRIGILNNSRGPQALKDGVLVYFSLNEESNSKDFIIAGQEISSLTQESFESLYSNLTFKEIENRNETLTSFSTEKRGVVLSFSFDENGELFSVVLRSLNISFLGW